MGVVYACHDLTNDRAIALKTIKLEYLADRDIRNRFLREAAAWVKLGSHPHIVRCYGVEYLSPITFLVLELIVTEEQHKNASLCDWIMAPLPLEESLLYIMQIARGMHYATERLQGFVHRDLKPENILVGRDKLPGTNINRLRVTDFGLVYFLRDEVKKNLKPSEPTAIRHTQLTQSFVGTPLYMAPEQWSGKAIGIYTDIYALGCILVEMLTGQPAASGQLIEELKIAHCKGDLLAIPRYLPKSVHDFTQKCLAIRCEERYQNWKDVISTIENIQKELGLSTIPDINFVNDPIEDQRQDAWSHNEIGRAYANIGYDQIAIDFFTKAKDIFAKIDDTRGKIVTLGNLAGMLSLHDPQTAIAYCKELINLGDKTGDDALAACRSN
jgi:serine/threonine protein kinase